MVGFVVPKLKALCMKCPKAFDFQTLENHYIFKIIFLVNWLYLVQYWCHRHLLYTRRMEIISQFCRNFPIWATNSLHFPPDLVFEFLFISWGSLNIYLRYVTKWDQKVVFSKSKETWFLIIPVDEAVGWAAAAATVAPESTAVPSDSQVYSLLELQLWFCFCTIDDI